jgi:hypothetical protein
MGFLSSIFGGGDPIKLTDQRTQEQLQAAGLLQQLGTTGSAAGINLGEAYTGSLGQFTPTNLEQMGLAGLFGQQPTNAALSGAETAFSQLAQTAFDPSVLEPFRKAAVRSEGEALDRLAQQKAITGSRFGTGFGRDAADLIEGTELGIQQQLANLFLNQQNTALRGAAGLAGVGGTQANIAQQNLGNLFNFGALQRNLANQEAQAKFNEFNRQRGEELSRINLLQTEADRNPYLAATEIPGSPSPFSQLIGSVLGGVGEGFGAKFGGDLFKSLFDED